MKQAHEPWGVVDPANPTTEILPGLFMGGTLREHCIDYPQMLQRFEDAPVKYDAVVTLYAWAAPMGFGVEERRLGFPDAELRTEYITQIHELSAWAHREWQAGKRVLIRCAGGMNRSGLITALILMRSGFSAADAIHAIQERRSVQALSNDSFVQYLYQIESAQHD